MFYMQNPIVLETKLDNLKFFSRGKVRDIYDLGDKLLIVTTDRISAFDCILPNGIPDKGRVLTQMTLFWLKMFSDIIPNHLITADVDKMGPEISRHKNILEGRTMLVKKAEVVPIECVVRGYIVGSAWKEYSKSGTICATKHRAGYRQADKLDEPIFTPSTKAVTGHDENISYDEMVRRVGKKQSEILRDKTLAIYKRAAEYALSRGIIIADTKFEFGVINGETIIVDEVLTPDSSRYWPKNEYQPGKNPPSFDKQYVRDYLETLKDWNKTPPAPKLPDEIVEGTAKRYREALDILTK